MTESSFASGKWPCAHRKCELVDPQLRALSTHLTTRALDVDRKDAELGEAAVLALRGAAHELVVHDVDLELRATS